MNATPRGLGAGLLAHLSAHEVTYIGGADGGGAISVMVDTANPEIRTVNLDVYSEPDAAPPCDGDAGYTSTSCDSTKTSTTEVLVRNNNDDTMPDLMGRFYDATRKNVLVQVWGSNGTDAESLVRELLADPLLGAVTSPELNDIGEGLADFKRLHSKISLREVD